VLEVEAPADGILASIKAHEGDVIPVGQTIAWILQPGEAAPEGAPVSAPAPRASSSAIVRTPAAVVTAPSSSGGKISPKARRLAKERNIDPARLKGSGPGGEILASDILSAAQEPSASPTQALSSIGRLMAERTTQGWTTVPHFFLVRDAEAAGLLKVREEQAGIVAKTPGLKLTHTDLLVALLAKVLRAHPRMNSSWINGGIRSNEQINIAIAVAVTDAVVAPVIREADSLRLAEIAAKRAELTVRARAGRLRPADVADATFTLSNLGMYHVDAFSAIISPPQVAILAIGSITDKIIALNGQPAVHPMMTMTLSCDHRVVDGARAALFFNDLTEAIQLPGKRLAF
jgi:pyruvate dehydrogenase E2 component (dihydrolipoamide acetyltransferase)